MPVINSLIDQASSFDKALDLIKKTEDLLDTKLVGLKAADGYKNTLLDLKFRCKKKLESESI